MKGSCETIPCELTNGKCQCKQYCNNCCGGLPGCYKIQNFKEYKQTWKEVPQTKNVTQLKIFQ